MSKLPCELLDHIVNLLPNLAQEPLPRGSRVPKGYTLRQDRFPNREDAAITEENISKPFNLPARYAEVLFIHDPEVVAATDGEGGSWRRGFSRV